MALKKCKECGGQYSTKAKSCPHCGAVISHNSSCLAYIGAIVAIVFTVIVIGNYSTSEGRGVASRIEDRNTTQQSQIYNEGDTVNVGYMTYQIVRSWWSNRLSDNSLLNTPPDAKYLFVELVVRNNDSKARTIPPFYLVDESSAEYESATKAWSVEGALSMLDSLNPSVQKKGVVVFDVPEARQYSIKVAGGFWSSKDSFIRLKPSKMD